MCRRYLPQKVSTNLLENTIHLIGCVAYTFASWHCKVLADQLGVLNVTI